MKTKTKTKIEKSVLQQLREIRDKISADIKDFTYEELMQYLKSQRTLHPAKKFAKTAG